MPLTPDRPGLVHFTAWSANSNASMQLAAPNRLRGRVIGLYFYAFNGTGPLGGALAGWLCARGGTELAFALCGTIGLVGTVVAARRSDAARHGGRCEAALRPRPAAPAADELLACRTQAGVDRLT